MTSSVVVVFMAGSGGKEMENAGGSKATPPLRALAQSAARCSCGVHPVSVRSSCFVGVRRVERKASSRKVCATAKYLFISHSLRPHLRCGWHANSGRNTESRLRALTSENSTDAVQTCRRGRRSAVTPSGCASRAATSMRGNSCAALCAHCARSFRRPRHRLERLRHRRREEARARAVDVGIALPSPGASRST